MATRISIALALLSTSAAAADRGLANSPDARAAAVEARMTDDERIQLLHGVGLSFTKFEYSGPAISGGARPKAQVTLANVGGRAGADVPQVYLTAINGRSLRRLVAFDRLTLSSGERKTITIPIDERLLADWTDRGWSVKGGAYRFAIARSADELVADATIKVGAHIVPGN